MQQSHGLVAIAKLLVHLRIVRVLMSMPSMVSLFVILDCLVVADDKKGKPEHLYCALHGIQTTLKCSGMDHTVLPAINTIPAFYLVSVHQMYGWSAFCVAICRQ